MQHISDGVIKQQERIFCDLPSSHPTFFPSYLAQFLLHQAALEAFLYDVQATADTFQALVSMAAALRSTV